MPPVSVALHTLHASWTLALLCCMHPLPTCEHTHIHTHTHTHARPRCTHTAGEEGSLEEFAEQGDSAASRAGGAQPRCGSAQVVLMWSMRPIGASREAAWRCLPSRGGLSCERGAQPRCGSAHMVLTWSMRPIGASRESAWRSFVFAVQEGAQQCAWCRRCAAQV